MIGSLINGKHHIMTYSILSDYQYATMNLQRTILGKSRFLTHCSLAGLISLYESTDFKRRGRCYGLECEVRHISALSIIRKLAAIIYYHISQ